MTNYYRDVGTLALYFSVACLCGAFSFHRNPRRTSIHRIPQAKLGRRIPFMLGIPTVKKVQPTDFFEATGSSHLTCTSLWVRGFANRVQRAVEATQSHSRLGQARSGTTVNLYKADIFKLVECRDWVVSIVLCTFQKGFFPVSV
jgi:hypothetical protein